MNKKGNAGMALAGIFIVMLVIAVIVGFMFLFTAQLKNQISNVASDGQQSTAYKAVNSTEKAGYDTVAYIPLVFLALIFSALLAYVIRMIVPMLQITSGIGI